MTPNWDTRLAPFASLYREMYGLIAVMGEDELRNLVRACDKPSVTNCGWHTYRVAPLIKEEAQQEIAARAYAKTQKSAGADGCTS